MELDEETKDIDPSVEFLYKAMLNRDPKKRRVKPVEKHLMQVNFGGDSDDDSDFHVDPDDIESGDEGDTADDPQSDPSDTKDDPSDTKDDPSDTKDDPSDTKDDGTDAEDTSDSGESESESDPESSSSDNGGGKGGTGRSLFDMIDSDDEDDEDYQPKKKQKGRKHREVVDSDGDYQPKKRQKRGKKTVGDDDDDDESDDDYVPTENGKGGKQQRAGKEKKKLTIDTPKAEEAMPAPNTGQMKVLICCVCLGETSEADDEIVECDHCGVAVHEGCYGVSDNQSAASTESSASMEPWFCESCKAGVKPDCELCPNVGGIFKETDAGKWVHLVCALYTPGVAFGDVDKLSPVTLFEMPYARWGAKECSLCEDMRFSRTGVCISCDAGMCRSYFHVSWSGISCDAGMCRSYFHVSCAQREGLLSEASPDEVMDIADPFFAYCKLHADKYQTKAKRRNWLAIQSHVRQHGQAGIQDEKERLRFQRKLNRHRQKYLISKSRRPPSWVPTHKMVRYLTSSPSVVKKMLRKAELMGIITQTQHVSTEKQEVRKKSSIPAALSVEFISHYLERNVRIENMKSTLVELKEQNNELRTQEMELRRQYDKLMWESKLICEPADKLRKDGERIWSLLSKMAKKPLPLPEVLKQKKASKSPTRREIPTSPLAIIKQCGICCKTNDQHLLAKCDACRFWYHLGCLNPPLTRMPKKTTRQGWQCSECARSSSDESDEASNVDVDAPRRLRDKIKEPAKFATTQRELEFLFPEHTNKNKRENKRKRASSTRRPTKKPVKVVAVAAVATDLAMDSSGSGSPIDLEVVNISDDSSMDVDIQIIEETTPIKISNNQGPSRSQRKRVKKKSYDPDSNDTPPVQVQSVVKKPDGSEDVVQPASTNRPRSMARPQRKPFGTECVTCGRPGDRSNMVDCDKCEVTYHFQCLDPPFRKTPKQRGYTWFCEACDSEDDSDEGT